MKHILLLIFTMYNKTGLSEECAISQCQEPPDWHDIFCKSVFNKHGDLLHVNCSWLPYRSSSLNRTEYKLHLMWPKYDCEERKTINTYMRLINDCLETDTLTTIWVSHEVSEQLCVKTSNFYILPEEKCDPPNIQHAVQSSGVLKFQLDDIGQVRYRQINSTQWHTINVTNMSATVSLPETLVPTSYVVQQRCLREFCFHCRWEGETNISHELTGAPDIFVTNKKLSPGKQRVTIEWKYIKHDYVDGYLVTIQRLPNSCNYNITLRTTDTMLHINLSVAFFNVFLSAYNRAGSSALVSTVVHPPTMAELPGKIFATHNNSIIFLTWSPLFEYDFVVINWGTSYSEMESKTIMYKIDNYSIPGPFQRMKRYMIMLYIYDLCQCQDSRNETTFGVTSIYPEEGVPRTGPDNITVRNVTKTYAVIEWGDIPDEDRLGFLLGYRIYCTDISRNTTLEVFLNSPSRRSHVLLGLKSSHEYEVTVSGVTSKGTGMPSATYVFTTLSYVKAEFQSIIISTCGGIIITAILVSVCVYAIHRKKKNLYFPKIPNPKHSNVIKVTNGAPTKIKCIQILHETRWDSAGVEVIEQIPILTMSRESSTQGREPCTNTSHHKGSPAQAPNAKDYIGMRSMINVLKKMPQTNNNIN